jgi:hypothetical protein
MESQSKSHDEPRGHGVDPQPAGRDDEVAQEDRRQENERPRHETSSGEPRASTALRTSVTQGSQMEEQAERICDGAAKRLRGTP